MALEAGLRTLLLAQSSITSLVPAQTIGGTSFSGIFVNNPTQDFDPPYILIKNTGGKNVCLNNSAVTHAIDIECCANKDEDAIAIGAAVNTFLETYSGAAGASDTIDMVILTGKSLDYTQEAQGRDVQIHKRTLTYQITAH